MKAGDSLGSYVIVREIGSGGMGSVYLAEHTALGRRAAIKVLQPELTSNQQMLTRFFNEARAASAIKSPGIVEIYDFGRSPDGSAYIVMELLEGEPLSARLARLGKLSLGGALVIARQIASALAPAHRAGIVHRDLKPDNVFLVPDAEVAGGERVKLLDFGIAKLLGDDERSGGSRLTSTKTVMGTPYYMSPEQCRGAGGVDARSDLYALGCMLYELLSGHPPFTGEGAGDLIGAHIYLPPRKLTELIGQLPAEVDELVQRLLAKAAAQRPQSAEEVASTLSVLAARFSATWASPTVTPPVRAPTVPQPPPPRLDVGTPMAGVSQTMPRQSKKSRGVQLAIASGLVALAAVGVFAAVRGSGASQPMGQTPPDTISVEPAATRSNDADTTSIDAALDPAIAAPANDTSDAMKAAGSVDGAPADSSEVIAAVAPAGEADSTANKRAECAQRQSEERWEELKKCAVELRGMKGGGADDRAAVAEFIKQADIEIAAKGQYDKFLASQKSHDMRGMSSAARNVSASSMYAARMKADWEVEKAKYLSDKRAAARAAAQSGDCGRMRELAADVRPYESRVAREIAAMTCAPPPPLDCNDPAVNTQVRKLFNDIQEARIEDPKTTVRLVDSALANPCLTSKRAILVRIGVIAACAEKRRDKVLAWAKASGDPALVQSCPEYLAP